MYLQYIGDSSGTSPYLPELGLGRASVARQEGARALLETPNLILESRQTLASETFMDGDKFKSIRQTFEKNSKAPPPTSLPPATHMRRGSNLTEGRNRKGSVIEGRNRGASNAKAGISRISADVMEVFKNPISFGMPPDRPKKGNQSSAYAPHDML
jgi:hypothetical protein